MQTLPPTIPDLYTVRLRLRPLQASDAESIQAIFPCWEVVQYLDASSVPWPYPADGAETHVQSQLKAMAEGRTAAWALTLREDPEARLIGLIEVSPGPGDNRGFWLAPTYWGQGLMTEAADRVTVWVMDELGWSELRTANAAANEASSRLKRDRGFVMVGRRPSRFVAGELEREEWLLTRDAWLRTSGRLAEL